MPQLLKGEVDPLTFFKFMRDWRVKGPSSQIVSYGVFGTGNVAGI
jgi:hypothetical protein